MGNQRSSAMAPQRELFPACENPTEDAILDEHLQALASSMRTALRQPGHECRVRRRGQALTQYGAQAFTISAQQSLGIEPQAGKDLGTDHAVRAWREVS